MVIKDGAGGCVKGLAEVMACLYTTEEKPLANYHMALPSIIARKS
jgi:hypothetical protein